MLSQTQITQARVSESIAFFRPKFLKKWGLQDYYSRTKPAIFKGIYRSGHDMKKLLQHKGLAVVLWSGTDAMSLDNTKAVMLKKENIKHIAISDFIAKDLHKFGLKYKRFNISSTDFKPEPMPLGDCIYSYISSKRPNFYGMNLMNELKKKIPYEFIISEDKMFPYHKMPDIYKKCFIGLRLTPHDGMSNTVVELGMMGRRCVWNNSFPGAYRWVTISDIERAILTESQNIINGILPFEIEKYFSDKSWLYVETWDS